MSMDMKTELGIQINEDNKFEFEDEKAERLRNIKERTRKQLYALIDRAIDNDILINMQDPSVEAEEDMMKNIDAMMNRVKYQLTKQEMAKLVDKAKFMFLVYMIFYSSLLISCILVFGGYVKNP
eukprot:396574_1